MGGEAGRSFGGGVGGEESGVRGGGRWNQR